MFAVRLNLPTVHFHFPFLYSLWWKSEPFNSLMATPLMMKKPCRRKRLGLLTGAGEQRYLKTLLTGVLYLIPFKRGRNLPGQAPGAPSPG